MTVLANGVPRAAELLLPGLWNFYAFAAPSTATRVVLDMRRAPDGADPVLFMKLPSEGAVQGGLISVADFPVSDGHAS